ncbi:type II toxin-antitoxin system HicA family toxin [Methanophagales archaeon]|nr:MAG: type II toxin-antitoxin system HicA family toxin [Methanophagales archaeon]RJS86165.1 MAG: type II toxin-antitoxin system HicA family toxin [Methanophagales archaeon]
MNKKLPAVTDREVIKVAKKLGFTFYRQAKGSHEVWRRVSDGRHTVIPRHAGKIIKRKTLKSIIDDFGITVEEFNELR